MSDLVDFQCVKCQEWLSAPETDAGSKGVCPKCDARFVIPAAADPAPAYTMRVPARCPYCKDMALIPKSWLKRESTCPNCRKKAVMVQDCDQVAAVNLLHLSFGNVLRLVWLVFLANLLVTAPLWLLLFILFKAATA